MQCQTYGYLPSHRASLSTNQYPITLLDDRHKGVNNLRRVVMQLGYWTTRGYANSWTGWLADWTSRGLVNSRTRQLVYWTSSGLDNSRMPPATLCAKFSFFWRHLRDRKLSSPQLVQSTSWLVRELTSPRDVQSASWRIRELSSYRCTQPEIETATSWSEVQHPTSCTNTPPK